MRQLLLINPNTSAAVTQVLLQHLRGPAVAPAAYQWHGATAAFGAPYIADERSYCIAGHAVLDAWERAQANAPAGGYDAVLVGCFGDPGWHALQHTAGVPVWGLAEAAVRAMAMPGVQRLAVVTGGAAWQPMLERWSRAAGYHPSAQGPLQITAITALPANGAQMMQSPDHAAQVLAQACMDSLEQADAVLLGGAGLAGMGARVRALTGAPVWDCVEAVQWTVGRWLQTPLAVPPEG